MPRCCGSATCACVLEEGVHVEIGGTGTTGDPFVISADVDLEVVDNPRFNLTLNGVGTVAAPWAIEVDFASTAKLDDLPDVNAAAPTNGQVLGWDSATSKWTARAPTTAAAGSVLHDTALTGDGSAGTPLGVNEDPNRGLTTVATGVGLNDAALRSTTWRFADSAARTAHWLAPALNTLSVLDSAPGQIDYWTGSTLAIAGGTFAVASVSGEEFYQMSGPYAGGRLSLFTRNVTAMTDVDGIIEVIAAADLAGRAGVMAAWAQPTGDPLSSIAVPFAAMLAGEGGAVKARIYRLDDGLPLPVTPVTLQVAAWVY